MKDNVDISVQTYNKIARQYAHVFDKDERDNPYLDIFLSYLDQHSRIVDLGSGTGRVTNYYTTKGFVATGYDLSEKMIEIAKEKYPNISFYHEDMRHSNFSSCSLSSISIVYALFHLSKNEAEILLKKCYDWLQKDGIIFLVLQEGEGEVEIESPFLSNASLYINLYTEQEIVSLLKSFHFSILNIARKKPLLEKELPYNKLFIYAKK